jgi:hypothetical protein
MPVLDGLQVMKTRIQNLLKILDSGLRRNDKVAGFINCAS